MPIRYMSSGDINAMISQTAPAVLDLLADGRPQAKKAIIGALAAHHAKADVEHTLMRLTVTGRLVGAGQRYALAADPHAEETAISSS